MSDSDSCGYNHGGERRAVVPDGAGQGESRYQVHAEEDSTRADSNDEPKVH